MVIACRDVHDMEILDLSSSGLVALSCNGEDITTDVPPADLGGLVPPGTGCVAIRFPRFSDGRGFTLARHLREAFGHKAPILARGHLIPDQAVYLLRCGFSHVEIERGSLAQWRHALALSPPSMQQVLASRRARDPEAATS